MPLRYRSLILSLSALALGLAGCNREKAPPSQLEQARYLYNNSCARCHGIDGKSGFLSLGGKTPQDFTRPEFQRSRSDAEIADAITHGKGAMPPFGKLYRPEEIQALVQVVRGFDASRKAAPASSGSQP